VEVGSAPTCLEVTNLEAAMFLVSGTYVDYLLPFFEKECSLSEAARAREVTISQMRYWANKMEELGLIKHTRTVKRKGSPVKYYYRVADEYKVPLKHIPSESLEELLAQKEQRIVKRAYRALAKAFITHDSEWYAHYYLEDGNPIAKTKPSQGTAEDAKLFSYWMTLYLQPEQAKALRADLRELQARYAKFHEENLREESVDAAYSITHLLSVQER
jgi:ketosteroid isomerase-like protein